jgi:beta-lactamase regulating signal transducer with metallopeptidase domain
MWFDSSLAGLSLWITYFLQVVCGYVMTLCICAFIQNPRNRVRVWGCFFFLTIAAWLMLWVPVQAGGPIPLGFRGSLRPLSDLHVALPVKGRWVSYVSKFAPMAWGLYLFLLAVSLLHFFLKSAQLKAVLRQTQQPSSQLRLLFRRLCHQLRIKRCELGLLSGLRSPATCYWLRSHVLLPAELIPVLESDQLADVLRHELIHVRRHDYLWDRLVALGCRLVFFHPLVWLAYRHLRWERELACDHAVVEEGAEARLRYAQCLTSLARWLMVRSSLSAGIGFSSSESLLASRVRALLSKPAACSVQQRAARAGLVVITASIALLLVPSLGLTLYSPVRFATLLTRSRNGHSDFARKKPPRAKSAHSSMSKAVIAEAPWMAPQPATPHSVNLVLEFQPASLPVLNSATTTKSPAEASSAYREEVNDDVRFHGSNPVWDEAPTPLASPPKWRKLVIGAITSGVGVATGRIDVDDVDGPHKRGRQPSSGNPARALVLRSSGRADNAGNLSFPVK